MYPTLEKIKRTRTVRRIPANPCMQRAVFRPLYTRRSHADSYAQPADIAICWKVPARQRYGDAIPSWDMSHPWRSPVQTESFRSAGSMRTELKKKP